MAEPRAMTTFQVLAEPVRLYLIELLCTGAHTSGDLAVMTYDRFGVSWGAVSRHLAVLRRAGFVRLAKDGPSRWYVLDEDWLTLIDEATRPLAEQWKTHIHDRSVGVDVEPFLHRRDEVDTRGEPQRGHRGRSSRNVAARGIGRSGHAEGADGGDGFE